VESSAVPVLGLGRPYDNIGESIHGLAATLYPICRSITGDGVRETLDILAQHIPLERTEVATGTEVFDWTVPEEWNIRDAYVKNASGDRVIDFRKSNLHVVSYSVPVNARMPLRQLREHLHTLPEQPDLIPYRTSYYNKSWGFCMTHNQLLDLNEEEEYEVCIDSSLEAGHLSYGECYLEGQTSDEVLIYCHVCHPSLCNDNLSSIALATYLAQELMAQTPRYSYRFIFAPGAIGSITWLCLNEARLSRIKHGLVLSCLGDPGTSTYKKSRRGDAEIDRAVTHVLRQSGEGHEIVDFTPWGHDERQFCSPGFNLPVGCLMRTPHGLFPEYHTSADNLDLVKADSLADSFSKCLATIDILENNRLYINQNPKCEPQLGKRGLYRSIGGASDEKQAELAMLWVLNQSDGLHDLLDIAERSGLPFRSIKDAADVLRDHDLLREVASVQAAEELPGPQR
jgi:aminopeptidase-like protein